MGRRGGWRPKRYITREHAPVWVPNGRWGPRRARVEQCATLAAEIVYHQMICDGAKLSPGGRATLTCAVGSVQFPNITAEVVANAVWRHGRLFLRCPRCDRRATRLRTSLFLSSCSVTSSLRSRQSRAVVSARALALAGAIGCQFRKVSNRVRRPPGALSAAPEVSMSPSSLMTVPTSSPSCQRLKAFPSV